MRPPMITGPHLLHRFVAAQSAPARSLSMPRTAKPPRTGQGVLTLAGQTHPVVFEIRFVDSQGHRLARGGVTGPPETMREAFKHGRARLQLDGGQSLDVAFVAHAEGSPTAYFESAGGR